MSQHGTAWKEMERRVARALGGVRLWRPDFGDSIPDGENDVECWDSKCYQRHAAVTLYLDAERKYKAFANGRRFLLVLFSRERNRQGDFVLLRMADYLALKKAAGETSLRPEVDFHCGACVTSACTEQCSRCRCEFG